MMTKIYNKVKAGALFMLLSLTATVFTACSPDEFDGADINGIPTGSSIGAVQHLWASPRDFRLLLL